MFKYIIDKGVKIDVKVNKYNGKNVNYSLTDIINKRFDEDLDKKNQYLQYLIEQKIEN